MQMKIMNQADEYNMHVCQHAFEHFVVHSWTSVEGRDQN